MPLFVIFFRIFQATNLERFTHTV